MKIAIAAYVEATGKFIDECNLMTFSGRGLDGRFTFVLYAHPDTIKLLDRYPNVVFIPYEVPEDKYYSEYGFAKSLVFVYDKPEPLQEYDYVCKVDTDVIFTPIFNNFPFLNDTIYVGLGYYGHAGIENDLKKIANDYGYPNYKRINNMHSSIISSTENMIKIMSLSDKLCKDMYYGLEEDGEWGVSIWRGHLYNPITGYGGSSGICSMYAAEIVISSLYDKDKIIVTNKIDAGSDWQEDWTKHYFYHCYHQVKIFSKHQAMFGTYLDFEYANGSTAAEYCLNTYLSRLNFVKNKPEFFINKSRTSLELPPLFVGKDFSKYSWED